MGGGIAVGLNIRGGGALTVPAERATASPAGGESACVERPAPTPSCWCSVVVCEAPVDGASGGTRLLSTTPSSSTPIVDVRAESDSPGV